jgi:hypothetical protein
MYRSAGLMGGIELVVDHLHGDGRLKQIPVKTSEIAVDLLFLLDFLNAIDLS